MRNLILAALVAGTASAPALAQYNPAAPFTGPRLEGVVGYEKADTRGGDRDGVAYGVGVGYDMQMGGAVVGIEAEATDSTVDACTDGAVIPGDRLCAEMGRDLYVGGRVGGLIGPSTLLYAKAGYVNGRAAITYDDGVAGTGDYVESRNLDGVRLGGGAEFALGPNSFAKAEYRYSNYERGFEKHQVMAGFGFRF